MLQQAVDFREESDALAAILEPLEEQDFQKKTLFKDWTIDDVLGHLHMFNYAADLTLEDGAKFDAFFADIGAAMAKGKSVLETQYDWLEGASGRALFEAWRDYYQKTAKNYEDVDPKARLKWAGPDMSARSCITARQMETWAHGQEVFDTLGIERQEADRIKNIAVIGINTFGWTFVNRKMDVPEDKPYVKLTAPSGETWEWNEPQPRNMVEGSAVDFCRVVTQTRNLKDTELTVRGETANTWMSMAQCFAGPPEDPPAPGQRHIEA